jgi:hypothetical protein
LPERARRNSLVQIDRDDAGVVISAIGFDDGKTERPPLKQE